jgi:hypothetical protein
VTNQDDKAARRKDATDNDSGEMSSKALAQSLGKIAAVVILIILALLIEHYCSYKPPPFGPGAKIVSVDGDSLRVGDGSEYRIFGIDAPELYQTCKEANGKSWACGRAAKARLTTLIKGGNVNCTVRDKDRFGRAVADRAKATRATSYAASGSARAGWPGWSGSRPTISAMVLINAWAPSISAAS